MNGVLIVRLSVPGRNTIFRHPLLGSTLPYEFQRVFILVQRRPERVTFSPIWCRRCNAWGVISGPWLGGLTWGRLLPLRVLRMGDVP